MPVMMARRIFLPVDNSETCKNAVRYYIENMAEERDEVFVVSIVEPSCLSNPFALEELDPPPSLVEHVQATLQTSFEASQAVCLAFKEMIEKAGVRSCRAFLHAAWNVGPAIVTSSQTHKADLIIMGTRGMGFLRRTFLGSAAHYVVHNSEGVSVMIIPPVTKDAYPCG